jgi:hypothetical protein
MKKSYANGKKKNRIQNVPNSINVGRYFLCNPSVKQQIALIKINKTDHETRFMLGTNPYMFRHQGAIFRKLLQTNDRKSNTPSGDIRL